MSATGLRFGFRAVLTPVAVATLLAACGGGGSSTGASSSSTTTTTTTTTTSASTATTTFPTGLSVGSPTDVSSTGTTTAAIGSPWNGVRFALDWSRSAWQALSEGDGRRMARLASALMPMGTAYAAGGKHDVAAKAEEIEKVLGGDSSVALASVLSLGELFGDGDAGGPSGGGGGGGGTGSGPAPSAVHALRVGAGSDASCYGPAMKYSNHQDAVSPMPSSGQLPTGDLGLWTETLSDGTPCVAAQLRNRVKGVKQKTRQGLVLTAVMRRTIVDASLSMPTAGNTTDLTTALQTKINAAMTGVTVEAATVALDAGGTTYTYRVVLNNGVSSGLNAKRGEVIMKHVPGGTATAYSGVLQIAGFYFGNDAAFGCTDQTDSGSLFKTAQVSTIKYSRAGANITFGSRFGEYCGHPASSGAGTDLGAEVAGLTSDGQLDPAVKLAGNTRGSTKGWRGNFTRFGGAFDKDTVAGNFLLAWQAGTGDSHSRALAASSTFDSALGDLTVKGYFAYAGPIDTTDGSLLGMICNWAGPGNSHVPGSNFQSQAAVKTSAGSGFTLSGTSKIGYAPTNSCSSTTTTFDLNVDNTIASGEGLGLTSALDTASSGQTVQQTIDARGYAKPSSF